MNNETKFWELILLFSTLRQECPVFKNSRQCHGSEVWVNCVFKRTSIIIITTFLIDKISEMGTTVLFFHFLSTTCKISESYICNWTHSCHKYSFLQSGFPCLCIFLSLNLLLDVVHKVCDPLISLSSFTTTYFSCTVTPGQRIIIMKYTLIIENTFVRTRSSIIPYQVDLCQRMSLLLQFYGFCSY